MTLREIVANRDLVAYCGLYCGACRAYLKGRCPGCSENTRAKWCKVRACCIEHGFATCADCPEHADPATCPLFHNFFSKLMGLVLNSNRKACILKVRELGLDAYAAEMARERRQTLPRRSEARPS